MSSFSTRRLISFQKDPLPLSFLLFLRKSFFGSNTPPLSEEGIFRQEGGERVTNERGERERFLCPRFNLPDKESPGIYPRLKNPLDMNRATVDVQRDDASFFLDRFLFCHLFPSPPPYSSRSSLFRGFYFPPDSSNLSIPLCIDSLDPVRLGRLFARKARLRREKGSCSPFYAVQIEYSSIFCRLYAVPTFSKMD